MRQDWLHLVANKCVAMEDQDVMEDIMMKTTGPSQSILRAAVVLNARWQLIREQYVWVKGLKFETDTHGVRQYGNYGTDGSDGSAGNYGNHDTY